MEITQVKPAVFRMKAKNASVVLDGKVTIESKKDLSAGKNGLFVISEPGEYEVEGISVFGIGQSTYLIQIEGLRVLYLDGIVTELSESQVEELGRIDVLIFGVAEVKVAVKNIEATEPTFVVPYEAGVAVESFVKAYEHGSREASSLPLSVATLPQDLTEVVVLK